MDIRTVEYVWNEDTTLKYVADVVVGDGTIIYDDSFDNYDERIFFYFIDEEEFSEALDGNLDGIDFTITGIYEEA